MPRQFLTAIDLAKNELQNARIQNLASAPGTPVFGQIYYNTTDNTLYWWNGTLWVAAKDAGTVAFGSITAETTFGGAASDGVAATAARSDHKHANPTHGAADHTTIPLNTFAVPTADVSMGGKHLTNLLDPANGTDAANKQYVDLAVAGLSWKQGVRAGTTANVALTGLQTIDGVVLVDSDRVLVKNQTTTTENGVYQVHGAAWNRTADLDVGVELLSAAVFVSEGTTQADTAWVQTANLPITLGTTPIVWTQFSGSGSVVGGAGLVMTGNTLNVVAGDTTLTVAADSMVVNTAVIATVAGSVPTARTITAGAGLTGGGDLSANRSIDIVAGDASIIVAADSIVAAPLTGDVTTVINAATISANAVTTAKIADNNVTDAKLADMPAFTVKGRLTGAGDPLNLVANDLVVLLGGALARKSSVDCAAALTTVIPHNWGTRDLTCNVYRNTTPWDTIECDVERTDANNVTVRFATAPTAGAFRIVLTG